MTSVLTMEEARAVSGIVRANSGCGGHRVGRIQISLDSGARVVLHAHGGTIAVYGPDNAVDISGAGILLATEDFCSIDDFESAYAERILDREGSVATPFAYELNNSPEWIFFIPTGGTAVDLAALKRFDRDPPMVTGLGDADGRVPRLSVELLSQVAGVELSEPQRDMLRSILDGLPPGASMITLLLAIQKERDTLQPLYEALLSKESPLW